MIGYRSGFGYDIHALVQEEGRTLLVGGVAVAHGIGAQAHSDGDVLVHALIDAILGALGGGDIGELFPDSDPQYKNIASLKLLSQTVRLIKQKKAKICNIDGTVLLQEIKLTPFKENIKHTLATVLDLSADQINIKAKTKEKMDATGRREAIEAYCAVLIYLDTIPK